MLKPILYGSGAMGVLTAGYLLGSVSLGGAFAQTSTPAPTSPAQSQTAPATREQGGKGQPEANEQAETSALAAQAKITEAQASATALGQFPGGTVNNTDLDSENGTVIYTVHVTDSAGKRQEAKVDATTGTLLPAEAPETSAAAEAPDAPETGETAG